MTEAENIVHYTGIRLRVNGSGNLIPILYSLDNVLSSTLVSIPMLTTTERQLTRLCNFQTQRMAIELKTTEINEIFRINRIIIFLKEVFSEFPA